MGPDDNPDAIDASGLLSFLYQDWMKGPSDPDFIMESDGMVDPVEAAVRDMMIPGKPKKISELMGLPRFMTAQPAPDPNALTAEQINPTLVVHKVTSNHPMNNRASVDWTDPTAPKIVAYHLGHQEVLNLDMNGITNLANHPQRGTESHVKIGEVLHVRYMSNLQPTCTFLIPGTDAVSDEDMGTRVIAVDDYPYANRVAVNLCSNPKLALSPDSDPPLYATCTHMVYSRCRHVELAIWQGVATCEAKDGNQVVLESSLIGPGILVYRVQHLDVIYGGPEEYPNDDAAIEGLFLPILKKADVDVTKLTHLEFYEAVPVTIGN